MKIYTIRTLKFASEYLRNLLPNYFAKIADSRCDKHNIQFGGDDRFAVFKTPVFLDCHTGYYGNSTCTSLGALDSKLAQDLLNRTLNRHMELILNTMADFAAADASKLITEAEKELAQLQELINSVKQ